MAHAIDLGTMSAQEQGGPVISSAADAAADSKDTQFFDIGSGGDHSRAPSEVSSGSNDFACQDHSRQVEAERDRLVEQLASEAHATDERLQELKQRNKLLVARARSAEERETGRRETYEALTDHMRQEHKYVVATLDAKLGDGAKELGLARESYDRLVAEHGKAAEANATQAKLQLREKAELQASMAKCHFTP